MLTEANGFGSLEGANKFLFFAPPMLGCSYGTAGATVRATGSREAFLLLELVQVHLLLPALEAAEGHFTHVYEGVAAGAEAAAAEPAGLQERRRLHHRVEVP